MRKLRYLLLLFFFIPCLDSQSASVDTTQILANIKKINELFETNVDAGKPLIIASLEASKKINFEKGTAKLYLLLTQFYILKGIPDSATAVIPELEKAALKCPDKNLTVSILLKIALVYSDIGDFGNAIKKAIEAQKVAEDVKNYKLLAKVNHDLGFIYSNKSLYKNALIYFKKGLEYAFLSKDTFSIGNLYARIGGVYNETNIPDSGLYFNLIGLKYFESIKMKRGIGVSYNNIAGSYELMKKYDKAIDYYSKALPIREELGDEYAITIINYNLGVCYLHMKKYDLSEKYLLTSLKRNKSEKDYPQLLETLKQLCVLHSEDKKLNLYKQYADEYMSLKDSITSAENIKAISELQEKYESAKKEKNILMLKKENEKQEEVSRYERKSKLLILLSSVLIVLLMSVFGFILYKRYKITQKQNIIIQKQKEKVEEQNLITEIQKAVIEEKQKAILDSIHYAKRIQQSILPTDKYIEKNIKRLKKQ
jgi:tetratricopeptide (TPR) repeat protein